MSLVRLLLAVGCGSLVASSASAQLTVHPAQPDSSDVVVGRLWSGWNTGCTPWLADLTAKPRLDGAGNDLQFEAVMELDNSSCPAGATGAVTTIPLGRLPAGNHRLRVGLRYTSEPDVVLDWHEVEVPVEGVASDQLQLLGARFAASASWQIPGGSEGGAERSGVGTAVPGASDNSGLFWFFAPSNWEVLVKILDGCSVNGHYWLLGFGATNVAVDLRVVDQFTGRDWRLANPSGQPMGTFADVEAFPCGE